ncbi:MAG: hypothetical protein ACTSSP_12140 [Candidatus Asgardarchaeia archaeon]
MLRNIYSAAEATPEVLMLVLWTILYSAISFVAFSKARLKRRE